MVQILSYYKHLYKQLMTLLYKILTKKQNLKALFNHDLKPFITATKIINNLENNF